MKTHYRTAQDYYLVFALSEMVGAVIEFGYVMAWFDKCL